jgi:hypothetical protein
MLVAQTAHHHRRCSVCNRAPSSRTRLYCDGRAPLERLARPLLCSLRQTARAFSVLTWDSGKLIYSCAETEVTFHVAASDSNVGTTPT